MERAGRGEGGRWGRNRGAVVCVCAHACVRRGHAGGGDSLPPPPPHPRPSQTIPTQHTPSDPIQPTMHHPILPHPTPILPHPTPSYTVLPHSTPSYPIPPHQIPSHPGPPPQNSTELTLSGPISPHPIPMCPIPIRAIPIWPIPSRSGGMRASPAGCVCNRNRSAGEVTISVCFSRGMPPKKKAV